MEPQQIIYTLGLDVTALPHIESIAHARGMTTVAYSSVEDFLEKSSTNNASCIVLDLCARGEEGLAHLDLLRRRHMFLPTVVLADRPPASLVVKAMRMGASSVLEKPPAPGALETALDEAIREEQTHRAARLRREMVAARLASLSEGEGDVLQRLMAGMANKNIAADLHLGLRTVELRRAKILKKLGAKSLPEMVRLVILAEPERDWPDGNRPLS